MNKLIPLESSMKIHRMMLQIYEGMAGLMISLFIQHLIASPTKGFYENYCLDDLKERCGFDFECESLEQ